MKPIKLKKEVYFDCTKEDLQYLEHLRFFVPYGTAWSNNLGEYFFFNQDVSFSLFSINYGAMVCYSSSKTTITVHNLLIADEVLRFRRESQKTDLINERALFVSMMNRFKKIILEEVRQELEVLIDTYCSTSNTNIKKKTKETIQDIINESFKKTCHEIRNNGHLDVKKNQEIIESEKKILDTIELLRKQTLETLN